jgi:hypothetical protein
MGERLTLDKLPPPDTRRWVIRRKAEVICAVTGNLLTREQAIRRYNISADEFEAWRLSVERHGLRGLHVDLFYARMGMGAADELRVGQPQHLDVIDIAAAAGDETPVFLAHDARADALHAHDRLPAGLHVRRTAPPQPLVVPGTARTVRERARQHPEAGTGWLTIGQETTAA